MLSNSRIGADAFGGAGSALEAVIDATDTLPVAPTAVASIRNDWQARGKANANEVRGPNTQSAQVNT
jgi:hypothetical protein